jgi:hypothetical protein
MTLSLQELTNARETVRDLLDLLQLKAYLFEVEPKDSHWEIRVDCRINDQWQSVVFEADYERLIASKEAGQPCEELLSAWQKHLGACTRNGYEGD